MDWSVLNHPHLFQDKQLEGQDVLLGLRPSLEEAVAVEYIR
jgi:hypothetical protein